MVRHQELYRIWLVYFIENLKSLYRECLDKDDLHNGLAKLYEVKMFRSKFDENLKNYFLVIRDIEFLLTSVLDRRVLTEPSDEMMRIFEYYLENLK